MSNYTAIIVCDNCGKELAKINAYHNRPDMFVPQDIMERDFKISSMFCQDCLNGKNDAVTDPDKCKHEDSCTYFPDGCGKCTHKWP